MNSIMDVNELFDAIRGIDLNGVIREIGRDTHILTQTEIIALAVTAAGLIDYYDGDRLVLINRSVTPLDSRADLLIQGSIGEIFSQL